MSSNSVSRGMYSLTRILVDIEAIITEFHKRAGMHPDFLFRFGMHGASATLLPEERARNNSKVTV